METKEKIASELNDVLTRNFDAIEGYKNAKENVSSEALKNYFDSELETRRNFMQNLAMEITSMGESPVESGSFAGTAHRKWMDLKAAISSNDEVSVVQECITGEQASLEEYDSLLKENNEIGGNLRSVLSDQKDHVRENVNQLKLIQQAIK